MSWAEEDWTVGLSGRVLQKVKELQIHHERLSRENKQKQLQLDNIHASLEKQTVKYEEVRGELQLVQRELQSVREEATAAVTSRERLTQELQTKQAQVCSLEGQLDGARTLNNKLTQEIKRLEAELEKLQNSIRSPDTSLFSTPCWNTTSPWEHNGSRQEEKPGHRDEGQSRAPHVRQRLQFSETPTPSLSRQQKSTRHSHPSDQSDTFSTPSAVFPWERDDTKPAARRRPPPFSTPSPDATNQGPSEQGIYGKDHRTETDMSSEFQSKMSSLEEELLVKDRTLKSIQNEVMQMKKELAAKELSLQKISNELSLAHTRIAQDSERASGAEQRLKQLQEELKCQRQNAESSRLQHQQRTKELEKQYQRDLTALQKERQCLEKQHQQEVNKLNQELQQARTLHNALQAQADKLSLQKQALEKELDTLKEKLKWTEGQLKDSQKKEAQTQAKLTEAVREAEGVAVSLEQSRKRERALEEEGRRLADELADTLHLLKELQEQKLAPPPQPVQFCPVGQSFSSQSSSSHHPRPSAQTKRPSSNQAEQRREEEKGVTERRTDITASYPSDREPGEGIDSEHISVLISPDSSECLQRTVHKGKSNEEENKAINEECDISHRPINNSENADGVINLEHSPQAQNLMLPAEKTPALKSEQTIPSEDLKKENAMLRSELQDVREELQKRLEDLEAQRRAETEARTRLKQLSRKHASQVVEREEKGKEWKAQLETERAETDRLRRTMAALEAEMKSAKEGGSKKEREEQEEEENKLQEDRESELMELNIQLKKQLGEVKTQLALEREERKREEEERSQIINTDIDIKEQLSMKVAELKAELDELKQKRENSQEEEKHTDANSPLTYLTLRDDELNSNIVSCDNKLLLSEEHLLFCQSTNQHNMLVSQAADDIQEKSNVIDTEHSPLSDDVQIGLVPSDLQKAEPAASDLVKEMERLKNKNAKETERANQCQVKLEALQSQVTRQTQQLTMAFEKQSQHITGLLAELQEKESALLSQRQELLQCKQELDALKKDRKYEVKMMVKEVEEEGKREEQGDEKLVEISELQMKQEKESRVTCETVDSLAESDLKAQSDASQPETRDDTQTATPVSSEEADETHCSGEEHSEPVDSNKTQSNPVMAENQCGQNREKADILTELLTLRQENQLLKQRIEDLTISDAQNPTLQTDSENQEEPKQSQNTSNATLSCLAEDVTLSLLNDVRTEGLESNMKNEDEGQDLEKEDGRITGAEEDLEEVSQVHVTHLQQQVEALQMKVRSLSEETQQQADELAVWRLASQPVPTFDECETHEQTSAVRQSHSNQQQTDEMTQSLAQTVPDRVQAPTLDSQKCQDNITVIREDELFLSCSSNKLQGRMLFSRLQNSSLTEPNILHPFKMAAVPQEYNQDSTKTDQESEKENQINFSQWSDNCPTVRRDTEPIQMSSGKMAQQHVAKVLELNPTKTEANPNTTTNSSDRDVKIEMKSVSSQTEESLYSRGVSTVCVNTQTEMEEEEGSVDSPPLSPVQLSEGAASGDKILFSGSFPIPADPARLAERIRRNRTQLSAAFDDTEYEPYGLPEVVMKGFADIPTGPACPYIVRRGLLGTAVLPVSQKDAGKEEEMD